MSKKGIMAKPILVIQLPYDGATNQDAKGLYSELRVWGDYYPLVIFGRKFDVKIYSVENDVEESTIEEISQEIKDKLDVLHKEKA